MYTSNCLVNNRPIKHKTLNVGIVGCGEISRIHLKSLLEVKKCRVISVCDIDKDRAMTLASEYKIPKVYTDLSSMLKEKKFDIIDVLTPPQAHASLSIEAMNAGCHVLVEKPMSITLQEADQMIEAAKHNNVKLGVSHSFLFSPAIRQALEIVRQGKIGDLIWVDTLLSVHPSPDAPRWFYTLPGGVFGELIPHGLYVQLAFLGKVKRVIGITRKVERPSELAPFSELQVVMDCEHGIGGLCLSTRIMSPYTIQTVRIVGSRMTLFANVPAGTCVKTKMRNSTYIFARAMLNIEPSFQLMSSTISLGAKSLLGLVKPHLSWKILIEKFIESVEKGSEPPVTAEEGREVVKATNMIWDKVLTKLTDARTP